MELTSEPALVPGITLCDLTIREDGSGKLSCIGCFHSLVFPVYPVHLLRFFVVAYLTNLRGVIAKLTATCRLEDAESGHVIASSSCELAFAPQNPPLQPAVVIDLAFPFHNVLFPKTGRYGFVVLVNNEEVGRRIVEAYATAPPAPPA